MTGVPCLRARAEDEEDLQPECEESEWEGEQPSCLKTSTVSASLRSHRRSIQCEARLCDPSGVSAGPCVRETCTKLCAYKNLLLTATLSIHRRTACQYPHFFIKGGRDHIDEKSRVAVCHFLGPTQR